jgi:hypothetical protein
MRGLPLLSLIVISGCARLPWSRAETNDGIEALYWRAVRQMDTATTVAGFESSRALLEAYLTSPHDRDHVLEATVLRRMALSSVQLTMVEASLRANPRQTETNATETKRAEPAEPRRDEEAVKEIQRLKDELAKANAELERIRKRLANPKDPQD